VSAVVWRQLNAKANGNHMNWRSKLNVIPQLVAVLGSALVLKFYYSTASVNQLRWILTPTTLLVEFVTGRRFTFESHAGYMSSDHTFLIAASCAGVNFLITAFLMLSLRRLWARGLSTGFLQAIKPQRRRVRGGCAEKRSESDLSPRGLQSWWFLPVSALVAYLATIVANTVRISIALQLQQTPLPVGSLNANQLHRVEGIFVYFGFLLLLYLMSERTNSVDREAGHSMTPFKFLRACFFPLMIYYATTMGLPLLNGAYGRRAFREHLFFVIMTPVTVVLLIAALQYLKSQLYRTGATRRHSTNQESIST
jgi:hypothetical protein